MFCKGASGVSRAQRAVIGSTHHNNIIVGHGFGDNEDSAEFHGEKSTIVVVGAKI